MSLSLEAERDRVEREWNCKVVSCREVSKTELEFVVRFRRQII